MLPPYMWEQYDKNEATEHFLTALQTFEVYVDNFIAVVQATHPTKLQHISRALLHAVHEIFPPPSETHHIGGDPISHKKLLNKEVIQLHL